MNFNGARLQHHRVLLLKISQKLTDSDLEELIYLSEDMLSESTAQKITSATLLFRELQHRACLAPNNYHFVRTSLLCIGRNDLANMLPSKDDENISQTLEELRTIQCRSSNQDQKKILLSISNQLRVEDVEKLAYLCSCDAKDGLELIQRLEQRGVVENNNYDRISDALMEIGRCDLGIMLRASTRPPQQQ